MSSKRAAVAKPNKKAAEPKPKKEQKSKVQPKQGKQTKTKTKSTRSFNGRLPSSLEKLLLAFLSPLDLLVFSDASHYTQSVVAGYLKTATQISADNSVWSRSDSKRHMCVAVVRCYTLLGRGCCNLRALSVEYCAPDGYGRQVMRIDTHVAHMVARMLMDNARTLTRVYLDVKTQYPALLCTSLMHCTKLRDLTLLLSNDMWADTGYSSYNQDTHAEFNHYLEKVLKAMPLLERLRIPATMEEDIDVLDSDDQCKMSSETLDGWLQSADASANIKSLHIDEIDDYCLQLLADCKHLEELCCEYVGNDHEDLAEALKQAELPSLTTLNGKPWPQTTAPAHKPKPKSKS